ncbi:SDR family oxidoreductase [Saccharothrix sp. S26]|uniref:SDR family oxidoreductase n=1 Tax=Saccharothrix sp. S26 TaxID=2907215 RepID=UPI001F2A5624|nr:SDR family oxidoreductase [Saccharothrix sp. S26]MCE6998366.1 SDR family oxidoreductase [Saccharothrix sp. S26]
MSGEFAGRVVLVTGGARGVGRAVTTAFAHRGAHVIVNYFHATAEAPRLVEELIARGWSAEAVRASVALGDQVDTMFDEVQRRHGAVDVLVNNAAAGALLPLDRLHESHWQRAVDTNLRGSLRCARRAARLMVRRGGGAIVNLSSIGSSLVIGDYATVGTTKAAVEALTRYLAVEFAPDGIRVNTASGGLLDGAVAGLFPDAERLAERVREATPLGHRLGREEELAELVVFLASPAASWITGQTVVADGGLSLGAAMLAPPRGATAPPSTSPAVERGSAATAAPEKPVARAHPRDDAVAVVGIGVVTPGANDPGELWRLLSDGRNVFRRPVLFDVTSFHATDPAAEDRTYSPESGFITDFRPHPRLAAELAGDPALSREATTLWLRHCLHAALERVGRSAGDRCFAAFGYTADGSQDLESHLVLTGYLGRVADRLPADAVRVLRERYDRLGQPPHEFLPHRVGRNAIAGLLPDATELVMVDTACSSSLYALDLGVKALREGSADLAVCGGAFAYSARNLVLFSKLQGLSRSGTVRCFDRAADGVLFSDGAGAVVLKRLDRAHADGDRVLGVVEGIGLAGDGRGKAIYAPNAEGQALALRRAYRAAGVDPVDVGWVVAHATGTRAGDSTEVAALREVAGHGGPALLSSNKAVVGHTGWAAGLVSLSQALSGLARGEAPAQPYLRDPIDAVAESRFTPPTAVAARAVPAGRDGTRRVGISSFGFGGTDAHLVLGEDRPDRPGGGTSVVEEEVVVVGWAVDVPGGDPTGWLRGAAPAPPVTFGDDYPLPGWQEVKLPPATLRGMDRTQIMVLRAAAALPAEVGAVLGELHDTTGVVVGHMGPTRRAVHYALRCYLGDLDRALVDHTASDADLAESLDRLTADVRSLVPAATEDSFPGIMPNIIASRLAAVRDFRGLNATLDGGPDSSLDALRAAERYLRHGDLDAAVVAGVNGNTTAEYRRLLTSTGETDAPAEGAFLVVLVRGSIARRHSLPVLCRLRTRFGPTDPATRPRRHAPLAGSGRTYLGADALLAVVARLAGGHAEATVGSAADVGTQVDLTVPSAAPPEAPGWSAPTGTALTRVTPRLSPAAPRRVRSPLPSVPPGSLVVLSHPDLVDGVELPRDARVVVAPSAAGGGLPTTAKLTALLPPDEAPFEHVRVLARVDGDGPAPADLSALDRLRAVHDLAFLAAKRWRGRKSSSYAVLITGAVRAAAPHPAAGLFTGLVKALARETPNALVFAVVTDLTDPPASLDLLARESARAHDLAVVVHAAGRRLEHRLVADPGPTADGALPRGGIVVAAGGTRGLTARLLMRLAEESAPEAVYLLGRHAPEAEALPTRAEFLSQRRKQDPASSVASLSAEYDHRAAAAETARTVGDLAAILGSDRVRFIRCDLTDPAQTAAAVDRVFTAHHRVDLLVNAAGRHVGGRVATTSLHTARGVRDTKVLAYLNLCAAFAHRRPDRWLNIGSLLAVLGWPGEADYCSANEVLGLAAHWRDAGPGGRETTFASPLWEQSGFAAEPVVRDLLRRQGALTGVSDREGVDLVLRELRRGLPDPEVTHLGSAERRLLVTTRRHALEVAPEPGGRALLWRPDPDEDGYFRHHRLHGAPTLPGAWIAELAVAASLRGDRDGVPVAVSDLVFHAPLAVLGRAGRTCSVEASDTGDDRMRVRVLADVVAPDGRLLVGGRPHAAAVVEFAARHLSPAPGSAPTTPLPETVFHYGATGPVVLDPPFACLAEVRADAHRARARFRPSLGRWAERLAGLRLPVLLVDALIQCALIADRRDGDDPLPIPTGVERVEWYTGANDVELLDRHGDGITVAAADGDAVASAPDGTPLVRLTGVRAAGNTTSKEVSRAGR